MCFPGSANIPRPSHADYTYQIKYGIRSASGGGRSSARETVGRVAAGAIADKFLMLRCQELGGVKDAEAYKAWNMGQGMLIMTSRPEKIISIAQEYKIKAKVLGKITAAPGLKIISRGYYSPGKTLSF